MDASTINSIRRKIASLERMTVANGCTPAEAANAMEMADRLRRKLPAEHPQSTYSQNYRQEQPSWQETHKYVHDYWVNEYFREFRQPLRERYRPAKPNEFEEILRKAGAFGKVGF